MALISACAVGSELSFTVVCPFAIIFPSVSTIAAYIESSFH